MVDPVAFSFGSWSIRWYGILLALGFFLGYMIFKKFALEKGFSESLVDDFFIWLVPSGIVGARLFEVLVYEPAYYFANPLKIFYVWEGGLASHGGMIGAFFAVYVVSKKYKMHFYDLADLLPVPFFIGAALGRIGNFINGELVGKVTSVPWAVHFQGYEGLRHPSQVYESFKNFFLAGVFFSVKNLKLPKGSLFWAALGSYSVLRFVVEFWKDLPVYYQLTVAQWISLPLIIISAMMFYKVQKIQSSS